MNYDPTEYYKTSHNALQKFRFQPLSSDYLYSYKKSLQIKFDSNGQKFLCSYENQNDRLFKFVEFDSMLSNF